MIEMEDVDIAVEIEDIDREISEMRAKREALVQAKKAKERAFQTARYHSRVWVDCFYDACMTLDGNLLDTCLESFHQRIAKE